LPFIPDLMNKNGPVVVIEDDADDREMLSDVFQELNYTNNIIFFENGQAALDYLEESPAPFLILSDINMPKMDGFILKERIRTNSKLHVKCIPYLFFTTSSSNRAVTDAYSMSAQGFFVKPNSYEKLKDTIRKIMDYWKECISPEP